MTARARQGRPLAYYNEIDPYAAQWLRNLIAAGHIAPGDVDERSIVEVTPDDLAGYTQCHFFAGIGVWSHALRRAGWDDRRRVWTGSCPCQPFSAAGKGDGAADPRHLWPAWFQLIRECAPEFIFGEQVASADGLAWLDLVHDNLEEAGYAVGALDLCAAGAGAPHIRQRLYFVADADRHEWRTVAGRPHSGSNGRRHAERGGNAGAVGHALGAGLGERRRQHGHDGAQQPAAERTGGALGDPERTRPQGDEWLQRTVGPSERRKPDGFWSDAIWLACRDGKQRPAPPEPEFQPLAYGASARVGRLRAYGNAICAPLAQEFIAAYMAEQAVSL